MNKFHPKIFEYLIKSYYYVGFSSYEYLLETLKFFNFQEELDLNKIKEEKRDPSVSELSIEKIKEIESISWSLKEREGEVYNALLNYIKSLKEEDIYKLLLVLFPDTRFKAMSYDNWNYYGEYVKDWHNNLIHFLELCGIKYDSEKKQLVSFEEDLDIKRILAKSDLIDIKFEDIFYRNLNQEINKCYKLGAYTASFILSRKLIENLVIDILRKKFPQNEENLPIYYRIDSGRFHDLTLLLKNFEERKKEFGIDEETIEEFFKLIKPFRPSANSSAHSIIVWGEKENLDKLQIEKMVGLLIKILNNIK
ncbi:MAG: hypothetical protein WDA74_03235 [Spirochaetota bacterium]